MERISERGEIGIHKGLKIPRLSMACGFKSRRSHHQIRLKIYRVFVVPQQSIRNRMIFLANLKLNFQFAWLLRYRMDFVV